MKQKKILVGILLILSVCLFSFLRGITRIKAENISATSSMSTEHALDGNTAATLSKDEMNKQSITEQSQESPLSDNSELVKDWNNSVLLPLSASDIPDGVKQIASVFRDPVGVGPQVINNGTVVQVTPDEKSKNGAIWSKNKLDLTKNFKFKAYLYLGNKLGSAADGMTFTLQNDPRMADATTASAVFGDSGMGLGAYSNKAGGNWIRNAISIEFDTYYNNGTTNRMDREMVNNGGQGHVAFVTPKSNNNNYSGEHSSYVYPPSNVYLSNDSWRSLQVEWNATTKTIQYNLEGVGSNSKTIDPTTQFGGNSVYWGFTGSTGGFFAQNLVAITSLPGSFESSATIQNLSEENSSMEISILANYNDQVKFENIIKTDTNVTETGNDVVLVYPLPSGVTYEKNSFQVNGTPISDDQLVISTNEIRYQSELLNDASYKINFNATVKAKSQEKLTSYFSINDLDNVEMATSNDVSITPSGTPQLNATVEIYGVNSAKKDTNGKYTEELKFGEVQEKVFDYGDTIDISNESIVLQGKTTMATNGWLFQNSVQQLIADTYVDTAETSITTTETTGKVVFLYTAKTGTIAVQFVDEAGIKLKDDVSFVAPIPDGAVDLTQVPAVTTTLDSLNQEHYQLVTSPKEETAIIPKADDTVTVQYVLKKKKTIVDPEDGVTPFTPENPTTSESQPQNETAEDLRIQYVSNFDFGTNTRNLIQSDQFLSTSDYGTTEQGQSKKVPAFVSINDDRKAPTGWDLSVSTNDFVNKATNTILKGAYMTLSNFKYNGSAEQKPDVVNKNVEISSTSSLVSSSATGIYGSWSLALGDVTSGDKSSGVNLTVPKNAARSLGEYQTEIVWTLTPKI